jgi:hypothetical protein
MFYISVAATAILVAYGLYSKRKECTVSENNMAESLTVLCQRSDVF